jgi:hypothetical protein
MQHERAPDKKRKITADDTSISLTVPQDSVMFLQIIGEYPYNYLVVVDPLRHALIYEDLLDFEKSNITIEMNNHEPESLYALYQDNVACPDKHVAWMKFFHDTSTRTNVDNSKHILLNRESMPEIAKARWFVCFSSR